MLIRAYNHARLMEESESRLEMAAYLHSPADVAASRLRETRSVYRQWEAEHARLMRTVSEHRRPEEQITALRSTAFGLVHRRALFDYLRERQITGPRRHRLFEIFYGYRDYGNAVIAEHHNYLRSSSSYLATQHLGENLMYDVAFDEPLRLYEEWYAEYFRAYCDSELAESEEDKRVTAPLEALRPLLKHRIVEARQAILAMPRAPDKDWRDVQIRKPNGDTQRMRTLFAGH
ncbi:MAG: hypothetical protein JO173_01035 [Gammaproteobacteria bacterium]|nr:hypothetical protein [Gammaproteobacteria bacterium]